MRFPVLFASVLRERTLCAWLLLAGTVLVAANRLGIALWACPFYKMTGLPCPGCGVTRGMGALAQGRWHEAVAFNLFTPVIALGVATMLVVTLLPATMRVTAIHALSRIEARTGLPLLTLIALVLWGFWRMWHGPWL